MSALEEYFAFARKHPEMFVNPSSGGFTILLDESAIRKAEAQMMSWLETEGLPIEWARVGLPFQDRYLFLLRDAVCFPDGSLGTYIRATSRVVRGPGVVILPFYRGQVLLIRHFRHATRSWQLEAPRGFGTKGLSAEENARKELREEIAATASRLVSIGQVHPDTGVSSDAVELFYADIESYGNVEALEGIAELLPVTVADFENLIRENKLTDGFTIVAYTRAKLHGLL